jgi:hypothetical protein
MKVGTKFKFKALKEVMHCIERIERKGSVCTARVNGSPMAIELDLDTFNQDNIVYMTEVDYEDTLNAFWKDHPEKHTRVE